MTQELDADVLIVEDDEPVRLLLQAIAQRLGMSTAVVPDTNEAHAHIRSKGHNVIIVDIERPGAAGILDWMRREAPHLLRRTIALTAPGDGHGADTDRLWCSITKPMNLDRMMSEMSKCYAAAVRKEIADPQIPISSDPLPSKER